MTCAEKLVAHYGGRKELAEAFGMTTEAVRLWLRDGIPLEKALHAEQLSGAVVMAEDIVREARDKAAA